MNWAESKNRMRRVILTKVIRREGDEHSTGREGECELERGWGWQTRLQRLGSPCHRNQGALSLQGAFRSGTLEYYFVNVCQMGDFLSFLWFFQLYPCTLNSKRFFFFIYLHGFFYNLSWLITFNYSLSNYTLNSVTNQITIAKSL